jgi:hypothetical protein
MVLRSVLGIRIRGGIRMKPKLLALAASALVTGMLAAGPATAADPIRIGIPVGLSGLWQGSVRNPHR